MSSTIQPDRTNQALDLSQRAIAVWRKAQVVHQGHSREGQPEALALAEEIASYPEGEAWLSTLLLDANQLVAAYSLVALEFMQSPVLQELPAELLQRRSRLTLAFSGIATSTDLGAFARQVQKRAAMGASEQAKSIVA